MQFNRFVVGNIRQMERESGLEKVDRRIFFRKIVNHVKIGSNLGGQPLWTDIRLIHQTNTFNVKVFYKLVLIVTSTTFNNTCRGTQVV